MLPNPSFSFHSFLPPLPWLPSPWGLLWWSTVVATSCSSGASFYCLCLQSLVCNCAPSIFLRQHLWLSSAVGPFPCLFLRAVRDLLKVRSGASYVATICSLCDDKRTFPVLYAPWLSPMQVIPYQLPPSGHGPSFLSVCLISLPDALYLHSLSSSSTLQGPSGRALRSIALAVLSPLAA